MSLRRRALKNETRASVTHWKIDARSLHMAYRGGGTAPAKAVGAIEASEIRNLEGRAASRPAARIDDTIGRRARDPESEYASHESPCRWTDRGDQPRRQTSRDLHGGTPQVQHPVERGTHSSEALKLAIELSSTCTRQQSTPSWTAKLQSTGNARSPGFSRAFGRCRATTDLPQQMRVQGNRGGRQSRGR
jgi:hypothetical protein